jgi:alkylation response protein AidB-like acyl-CoA dehydrogenase
LCAIALTEPRGGSDAANLRLRVERGRRLSAQRREDLDLGRRPGDIAVVFGRTGTVESGAHGVTALLVPMDRPASPAAVSTAMASAPSAAARCSSRTCACPSTTGWGREQGLCAGDAGL